MLEQVLQHLNNWFLVPGGIHAGEFTVQDLSLIHIWWAYPFSNRLYIGKRKTEYWRRERIRP